MMYPPSLDDAVRERAFRASNEELGFDLNDVPAFLTACRHDGVEVLGWELWLADHSWGSKNEPITAAGLWCGGIPIRGEPVPAVIGGTGDADTTERQLGGFDLAEVKAEWLPFVRVNFTLDG